MWWRTFVSALRKCCLLPSFLSGKIFFTDKKGGLKELKFEALKFTAAKAWFQSKKWMSPRSLPTFFSHRRARKAINQDTSHKNWMGLTGLCRWVCMCAGVCANWLRYRAGSLSRKRPRCFWDSSSKTHSRFSLSLAIYIQTAFFSRMIH